MEEEAQKNNQTLPSPVHLVPETSGEAGESNSPVQDVPEKTTEKKITETQGVPEEATGSEPPVQGVPEKKGNDEKNKKRKKTRGTAAGARKHGGGRGGRGGRGGGTGGGGGGFAKSRHNFIFNIY
ncbi:homeobox protein Hox-B3-like [Athalia rosae]|uniref:homeobox protein Hox-B3-like n=1 Tax=Athalia rosae TaxID=37344 RepID=UPI00203466F6|nr:homeobox protein Hox-B3-like [Athalia rosae]